MLSTRYCCYGNVNIDVTLIAIASHQQHMISTDKHLLFKLQFLSCTVRRHPRRCSLPKSLEGIEQVFTYRCTIYRYFNIQLFNY